MQWQNSLLLFFIRIHIAKVSISFFYDLQAQLTVNVLPSRDADRMITTIKKKKEKLRYKKKRKKKNAWEALQHKSRKNPKKGSGQVTYSPRNFRLHTHNER